MRHTALIAVVGVALEVASAAPAARGLGILGGIGRLGGGGGGGKDRARTAGGSATGAGKAAGGSNNGGATRGGGNGGGRNGGGRNGNGNQQGPPSARDIANARDTWQADTNIVSNFLSSAESMDPRTLQQEASRALDAENDEPTHKAVLDRQFNDGGADSDPAVRQANQVLERQGTFQFVVDGLERLTNRGASMTPQRLSAEIGAINQDRCQFVLPSIDVYLNAASGAAQDGKQVRAIRPTNCPGDTGQATGPAGGPAAGAPANNVGANQEVGRPGDGNGVAQPASPRSGTRAGTQTSTRAGTQTSTRAGAPTVTGAGTRTAALTRARGAAATDDNDKNMTNNN